MLIHRSSSASNTPEATGCARISGWRIAVFGGALLAPLGSCGAKHVARSNAAACETRAADVLRDTAGRPAYVEARSAIRAGRDLVLLGMPALLWATRDSFDVTIGPSAGDTLAYLARRHANLDF